MNGSKHHPMTTGVRWLLLGMTVLVLSCASPGGSSGPDDAATPDANGFCTPGSARCSPDGAKVQICAGSGDWLDDEVCDEGVPCYQGACSCPPCHMAIGGECRPVGVRGCAEGWQPTEKCGCEPILSTCPEGELPLIGGECHPLMAPCADDWKPGAEGGCEPIVDSCPDGAVSLFGGGCRATGPQGDCGEAPWGFAADAAAPEQTIWYVLEGWGGGGAEGSESKPFASIDAALEMVESGDLIVLGAEDSGAIYDESVTIFHDDLTIAGRCHEMVRLAGQQSVTTDLSAAISVEYAAGFTLTGVTVSAPGGGVMLLNGENHTLRDVAVTDNGAEGIMAIEMFSVHLIRVEASGNGTDGHGSGISVWRSSGIVVEDSGVAANMPLGVYVKDSEVSLRTSLVEGNIGTPGPEGAGYGFNVHEKSALTLEDCGVRFNEDTEVLIGTESSAHIERCWIGDAGYQAVDDTQPGITLQEGSVGEVIESVVSGNVVSGISADESVVEVTRTLVTGNRGIADEFAGRGIQIQNTDEPSLIQDSYVIANHGSGITVSIASAEIRNCVVAHTRGDEFDMDGRGLGVEDGASVLVDSSLFIGNKEAAIIVIDSALEVRHSWLRDTTPEDPLGTAFGGHGVGVNDGALTIVSSTIADNNDLGVYMQGGTLALTDSIISGTTINGDETLGEAVEALDSLVTVDWCAFTGNHSGALLLGGCDATVTGGLFEGPDYQPDGTAGDSIAAINSTSLDLTSSTFRRNYAFGVVLSDGTTAKIADSSITDTRPDGEGYFGYGVLAQSLSDLVLEGSLVSTCAGAGVDVYNSEATLSGNRIDHISESNGVWLVDGEMQPSETPFADGVLATHGATVDIQDNLVEEAERSCILVDEAAGSVSGNHLRRAMFGLVAQDSEIVQEGNTFEDCQTEMGLDMSAGLSLPGGPAQVPEPVVVDY